MDENRLIKHVLYEHYADGLPTDDELELIKNGATWRVHLLHERLHERLHETVSHQRST